MKGLSGKYFHTWLNGEVSRQGYIIDSLEDGRLRVGLFSFLDGAPVAEETIPFSGSMTVYGSAAEMRAAWVEHRVQCHGEDRDWLERANKVWDCVYQD